MISNAHTYTFLHSIRTFTQSILICIPSLLTGTEITIRTPIVELHRQYQFHYEGSSPCAWCSTMLIVIFCQISACCDNNNNKILSCSLLVALFATSYHTSSLLLSSLRCMHAHDHAHSNVQWNEWLISLSANIVAPCDEIRLISFVFNNICYNHTQSEINHNLQQHHLSTTSRKEDSSASTWAS